MDGEQYAAPQGRIAIKTAASDVPTNESDKKVIAGRDTTVTEGDTYTVVAGDCLWNIAYKLYGTGTLYTKLAEANKLAHPYIIYIGRYPDRSRQVKNRTITGKPPVWAAFFCAFLLLTSPILPHFRQIFKSCLFLAGGVDNMAR